MANNQLLASDNFASGSLAAGWSAAFGLTKCQVIAGSPNITEPTTLSTNCGQIWTGLTWTNDQTSEVIVKTLTAEAGTLISLYVRMQVGAMSGYRADFSNGVLTLFRFDTGTSTSLGSVSGLTFASGDRLTLQAAGASLAVYQNNKPLLYKWDTTYPSGSPGFLQFSSVNLAHTQVQSWGGYNGIQQDGIWQKQGILLPALASFAGNNQFANGTQNPYLIFEGNAHILSGTVYKMWYQAGLDLYYAESTDGKNWSQYSGNPVVSHTALAGSVVWDPALIKNGATYYLYAGAGPIYRFSSSDGITWSVGTQITLSAAQPWEAAGTFWFTPVFIDGNGTWYAMYLGFKSGTPDIYATGLATSTDGLTWTRHSGNPVIQNCQSIRPYKIGGVWYGWSSQANQGQNNSQGSDPGEGVRYFSSDLISWTGPINSVHHMQLYENVNGVNGGFFPQQIINVNGQAHLYGTSIYSDLDATGMQQISVAVAPVTAELLVTQPENALQQTAFDNFQRTNENPLSNGGKWTSFPTRQGMQIVSGVTEPAITGGGEGSIYSGAIFSNDQYSSITIHAIATGGSEAFPVVRASINTLTQYFATIGGIGVQGNAQIAKLVSGSQTLLGPGVAVTPQAGDVFTLSVIGQVISLFQNGFLVVQVEDGSIATGSPGFGAFAQTSVSQVQISSWAGGNAGVIPAYPALYSWLQGHRNFTSKCGVR